MLTTIRLILGMLGCFTSALGLAACFMFGFLPICRAFDADPTVRVLTFAFLAGLLLAADAFRLLRRLERQANPATFIYDPERGRWIPVSRPEVKR